MSSWNELDAGSEIPRSYTPLVSSRWLYGRIAIIGIIILTMAVLVPITVDIGRAVGRMAYQHITGVSLSP